MNQFQLLCCLTILLGVLPASAFAYIDPGTGATFVGSMGPLIVGIIGGAFAFFLKIFWHPIRGLFGKKKPASDQESPEEN